MEEVQKQVTVEESLTTDRTIFATYGGRRGRGGAATRAELSRTVDRVM